MEARVERSIAHLAHAAESLRASPVLRENVPPACKPFIVTLQTCVGRLEKLHFEQYTLTPSRVGEGTQTENLRKRLRREYMIPLARVGKQILKFAPHVERTLKVPHAHSSHRELVTTAEVMLKTVRPHQKLFFAENFSKTFFTEFRDLTRELRRIATTSSERQRKFAEVTRAVQAEIAIGNEALGAIDGLLLGRADRDPTFARTWKMALRTPKPLGRPPANKRRSQPNDRGRRGSREEPPNA